MRTHAARQSQHYRTLIEFENRLANTQLLLLEALACFAYRYLHTHASLACSVNCTQETSRSRRAAALPLFRLRVKMLFTQHHFSLSLSLTLTLCSLHSTRSSAVVLCFNKRKWKIWVDYCQVCLLSLVLVLFFMCLLQIKNKKTEQKIIIIKFECDTAAPTT